MHSRNVPEKRNGSWGMILSRPRTSDNPSPDRSIPSSIIEPDSSSTSRKRATVTVVFPAPVRPTIPHRLPPSTTNESPVKARGKPLRYLRQTLSNSTRPSLGHAFDNPTSGGVSMSRSLGSEAMECTRSIEVIAASASPNPSTKYESVIVKLDDHMISSATRPGSSFRTSLSETTRTVETRTTNEPSISIRTPSQRWAVMKFSRALLFVSVAL
mmetsp:Transcript_7157/g.10476  ORF Transcript_7157/g.10476 Transcript_7157/m.10476 type:complete len:213 (+) Transcript_7157:623-1261(+)